MSDFELDYESVEEILSYPVLVSQFESESEQRRIITSKKIMGFKITSPSLTKTGMQEYRDFFIAKYGKKTGFTFTSPFDDVEYTVRFDSELTTTYSKGFYKCTFTFKIINTDEA